MSEKVSPDSEKDGPQSTKLAREKIIVASFAVPFLVRQIKNLFLGQELESDQGLEREGDIGRLQSALETTYQINIELGKEFGLEKKWQLLVSLRQVLLKYPPTLFSEFSKTHQFQLNLQAAIPRDEDVRWAEIKDIDRLTIRLQDGLEEGGGNYHYKSPEHSKGPQMKISVDANQPSSVFINLLHHEIGHFIHHVLSNLSVDLLDFESELQDSDFLERDKSVPEWFKFIYKLIKQRLAYPGYASGYGMTNTHEDFAELWAKLMTQRGLVFPENKYEALKIQGIKQMFFGVSNGLMDDDYWQALEQGKIDQDFWEDQQPELNFFTDDESQRVVYLTDLDPGRGEHRLPALVDLDLTPRKLEDSSHDWRQVADEPMTLSGEKLGLELGSQGEINSEQRVSILLKASGRYSQFLSLYPGTYVAVKLQTFDEELSFQVGVDAKQGVLISELKQQPISNLNQRERFYDFETLRTYLGIKTAEWRLLLPRIEMGLALGAGIDLAALQILTSRKPSKSQEEVGQGQEQGKEQEQKQSEDLKGLSRRRFLKLALGATVAGMAVNQLQTTATPGFDLPSRELLKQRIAEMKKRHGALSSLLFPPSQEIKNSQGRLRHYLMPLPDSEQVQIDPQVSTLNDLAMERGDSELFWLQHVEIDSDKISASLLTKRFDSIETGTRPDDKEQDQGQFKLETLTKADLWVIRRSLRELKKAGYSWQTADISTIAYYWNQTHRERHQIIAEVRDTPLGDRSDAYGQRLMEVVHGQPACQDFEYCYVRLDAGLPSEKTFIFFSLNNDGVIKVPSGEPIMELGTFEGWDSELEVPNTADITA